MTSIRWVCISDLHLGALNSLLTNVTSDGERCDNTCSSPVLTARELEVLGLMAQSKSNREIAEALFISENTVKNHVRNILEKLHLHSRMEAVLYALQKRLLDPPA